jgi:hypothetical protein
MVLLALFSALAQRTTSSAGGKKSLDTRKPPFVRIDAGLPTALRNKRRFCHE